MRLLIHVEGQTEETFVNEVLAAHLYSVGFTRVAARLLGNSRMRQRRGGGRSWTSVRDEITAKLREDPESIATTMVDYYALPATGSKAWPGRHASSVLTHSAKSLLIEKELLSDVCQNLSADFDPRRFIPYVMMHEYEGMLFSDCGSFAEAIGRQDLKQRFEDIRSAFRTPEEINDSPLTAPSKRIEALVPGYDKPLFGVLAALEIGLPAIRSECPHFNEWLESLERVCKGAG